MVYHSQKNMRYVSSCRPPRAHCVLRSHSFQIRCMKNCGGCATTRLASILHNCLAPASIDVPCVRDRQLDANMRLERITKALQ